MKYLANVTTLTYVADKCVGCGRCVEVCPHDVLVLQDRRAHITDPDRCMECGACALNCDFGALAVNSGVGCATVLINSIITGQKPSCGCGDTPAGCCG